MAATTTTYAFTLRPADVDVITPERAEALFEAGCDDSSPGSWDGVVSVHFDREAHSLGDAIGPAVNDVTRAGFRVSRVEVESASASASASVA